MHEDDDKRSGKRQDAPTRRGNQFDHRAHDRMMRRKPTAKTKERRMTAVRGDVMSENFKPLRRENELLSPADIVGCRQT